MFLILGLVSKLYLLRTPILELKCLLLIFYKSTLTTGYKVYRVSVNKLWWWWWWWWWLLLILLLLILKDLTFSKANDNLDINILNTFNYIFYRNFVCSKNFNKLYNVDFLYPTATIAECSVLIKSEYWQFPLFSFSYLTNAFKLVVYRLARSTNYS